MTDPKRMDSEALAELRRSIHPTTHPSFAALLADRDWWEAEATRLCTLFDEACSQLNDGDDHTADQAAFAQRLFDDLLATKRENRRLRARLEVDEQDVDEADIGDVWVVEDSPKIVAWMAANGFERVGYGDQHRDAGIWLGDRLVWEGSPIAREDVVNALAHAVCRPPLDVLAEIAAMEVIMAERKAVMP